MKVSRIEKHNISKNHPMWSICDEYCFKSKNLYNYTNYIIRQSFINNQGIPKYNDLAKELKTHETFKDIGSNSGQHTIKMLCRNWKSFMALVKTYNKNSSSLLGRPKMPKYKKKDGRYVCILTNWQTQIKDGYLFFAFKPFKPYNNLIKTNVKGKHMQTRIIPNGGNYSLEIVYEIDIPDYKEFNNRIAGIDLGVDNLATCVNNVGSKSIIINGRPLKSINQFYNKEKAQMQSNLKKLHNEDWSNKLQKLQNKRDNKIDYYLHCASKSIVNYCEGLNIDTVIIGLNKTWKQKSGMTKIGNQNFISIPYCKFISQLEYKLQNKGIKLIVNEESYTSGCSFLDNEPINKTYYNKDRRITRGLFKSNNGTIINADSNGAYNIIKKAIPEAFANGIEGVDLHPLRVNV